MWLGSHWSSKIRVSTLRTALAVVLIGGGLGLLTKAGAGIPPVVIGAVPVVLAVVVIGQELRRRSGSARRARAPRVAAAAAPAPER